MNYCSQPWLLRKSYYSSIPNDVSLDTAGTWKMAGYCYDARFKQEQFRAVSKSMYIRCRDAYLRLAH